MMDQQDTTELAKIEDDKFLGIAAAKTLHGGSTLCSAKSLSKAADIAKSGMDSIDNAVSLADNNQGDL